jgi:hypothetical protein
MTQAGQMSGFRVKRRIRKWNSIIVRVRILAILLRKVGLKDICRNVTLI